MLAKIVPHRSSRPPQHLRRLSGLRVKHQISCSANRGSNVPSRRRFRLNTKERTSDYVVDERFKTLDGTTKEIFDRSGSGRKPPSLFGASASANLSLFVGGVRLERGALYQSAIELRPSVICRGLGPAPQIGTAVRPTWQCDWSFRQRTAGPNVRARRDRFGIPIGRMISFLTFSIVTSARRWTREPFETTPSAAAARCTSQIRIPAINAAQERALSNGTYI